MSWDRVEGQWKQRRGKALNHWGRVMNDELAAIAGRYEENIGKLQEKYGIAKEESRKRVDLFKRTVAQLKESKSKMIAMQKALSSQKKADRKSVKSKTSARKKLRSITRG